MTYPATTEIPEQTPEKAVQSINSLIAQVHELKSKNAWTHIVAAFHPLAEKHPQAAAESDAHRMLAEIAFALSQLNRFQEAIEILKNCISASPGYYRYLSALAFNYYNALMFDKGRQISLGENRKHYFEQAEAAFAESQKAFPDGVVDYYRQGMLYHHIASTRDRKAVPYFLKAIENWEAMGSEAKQARHKDHKNYVKALYHLSKSYIRLGDGEKAFDAIEVCIREDEETNHEEQVHKFYLAGRAHMEMDNYDDAVKFLRVAANKRTRRPKDYIYETLARCLMYLNKYGAAVEWIEKIPAKYRKPYVTRLYGMILARSGDVKKAEEQFGEALRRDRMGKHKTLLAWGLLYFEKNDFQKALDYFNRANSARRKNFTSEYTDALFYSGRCHMETGNREKAVEAFRKVLSLDDRHHRAAKALRVLLGHEEDMHKDEYPIPSHEEKKMQREIIEHRGAKQRS